MDGEIEDAGWSAPHQVIHLEADASQSAPGKIIYDPFVGTGSMLYSCAKWGATVIGSDIDGRQMRGTPKGKGKAQDRAHAGSSTSGGRRGQSKDAQTAGGGANGGADADAIVEGVAAVKISNGESSRHASEPGIMRAAAQYGVRDNIMDCLTFDVTQHPWRMGGWLDAIVTDPPCELPHLCASAAICRATRQS